MTKPSHCISGSIAAGCFSTLLGHPLDTIKVHQQTQHINNNVFDTAKLLSRGDVLQLFRGIGPPMANQIIMNTVMFTVFDKVKDVSSDMLDENSSALVAGLFSGFATACLSTPADWFKIQSQMSLSDNNSNNNNAKQQPTARYNMWSSLLKQQFIQDRKFDLSLMTRTVYRGHIANLGREGVFTMVYLGLYDRITNAVKARRRRSDDNFTKDQPLSMGDVIVISSFTGACAWIANYPFDTVKTVIQAGGVSSTTTRQHTKINMTDTIRLVYNSGGFRAFWRGVGSSTFRAMLVTSSRMLAYEKTIQMLNR